MGSHNCPCPISYTKCTWTKTSSFLHPLTQWIFFPNGSAPRARRRSSQAGKWWGCSAGRCERISMRLRRHTYHLFFLHGFLWQTASSEPHTETLLYSLTISSADPKVIIEMSVSNWGFHPNYLSCFLVQMMWQTDSIQCKKGHIDIEGKEGCFTKGQVDVFQVTGRTKLYNWAFHPPQYICSMCILHETMWSNKTELSK